ncbi:MAG: tetratricopeptide repeat protein [Lawsonibacter sp.]|nr:tetratricopeptide repeat protein [Lawsonibacter sp.]
MMKGRKGCMHKRIFTVFLLLIMLSACAKVQSSWQEQYDLGTRFLSEGNYEEAIIAFTAAIEIDSKQAPAYVGRGNAYVASGETEENMATAQADYGQAIELDATNTDAYLGLADIFIWQGDYDKALEVLQEALEISGDTQVILDAIEDLEKNKSNDLYIENYKATLGQYPEYVDKGWGTEYTEYTLYDIDENGIPELIIKEPEIWNYVIYTFDGIESVQCGELWDSYFGTYAELYEYEGNGVLIHGGGMGSDRVEYMYVQQLIDNRLNDGELSASTEDISFDELYDMLDDYTPINDFHHSSDLSLLGG